MNKTNQHDFDNLYALYKICVWNNQNLSQRMINKRFFNELLAGHKYYPIDMAEKRKLIEKIRRYDKQDPLIGYSDFRKIIQKCDVKETNVGNIRMLYLEELKYYYEQKKKYESKQLKIRRDFKNPKHVWHHRKEKMIKHMDRIKEEMNCII